MELVSDGYGVGFTFHKYKCQSEIMDVSRDGLLSSLTHIDLKTPSFHNFHYKGSQIRWQHQQQEDGGGGGRGGLSYFYLMGNIQS